MHSATGLAPDHQTGLRAGAAGQGHQAGRRRRVVAAAGLLGALLALSLRCVPGDPPTPCLEEGDAPGRCMADGGPPGPFDLATGELGRPDLMPVGDAGPGMDAGADGGTACPSFAAGTSVGRTPAGSITEASGIVAGRRNPGTLWLHNDSGAGPRIHAVSRTGAAQAMYDLSGATATDWEDIAIGPGPTAGVSYLYIGDIGDNAMARAHVDVYRVAEPDVTGASPTTATPLSGVEHFTLVYPDRAHNAETLLVDPTTGDLYIVVKSGDGVSPVFRAAAPLSTAGSITLTQVAMLRFGTAPLSGGRTTTAGDISPGGDEIAIRTYDAAYLWRRAPGMTVAAALAGMPCRLPLSLELQGEALGFAADGSGYYTVSEGTTPPIYFYARR